MTNALAQTAPRASALAQMASRLSLEPEKMKSVLKSTVFSACRNDEELAALVVVANEYNLNPLLREIYAFPSKGGGIVPVVSVDGWIKLINSHPQMDGMEFEHHADAAGELAAITCTIFRKDRSRPIKVTEHLSECFRNTEPWKMKNRMLRHKALKECARVAFGFSGVHDEDEADDIVNPIRAVVGREIAPDPIAANLESPKDEPRKLRATRESKPAEEPAPFAAEPEPVEQEQPAPDGPRGDLAYYDRTEIKSVGTTGKKKFVLHFQRHGGAYTQADTFSETVANVVANCEEGQHIRIETTPNKDPRYNDALVYLALEEGGAA